MTQACIEGLAGLRGLAGRTGSVAATAAGYTQLHNIPLVTISSPNLLDLGREEEVTFYNYDGTFQKVLVEPNLRAVDLCQLLAVKNRRLKDPRLSVLEYYPQDGLERVLEDHEDVLEVYRNMLSFKTKDPERRFMFRLEERKYDFFTNPTDFFPSEMADFSAIEDLSLGNILGINTALQAHLLSSDTSVPLFSSVWVKEHGKNVWQQNTMLMCENRLYLSSSITLVARFMRDLKYRKQIEQGENDLRFLCCLKDYTVYWLLNARKFNGVTEFGLYLSASNAASATSSTLTTASDYCHQPTSESASLTKEFYLAFESQRYRGCWFIAMRLAKYGRQLRENYIAFKNKQAETYNSKEYGSFNVPNESVRSRVAMDFTGSVGRIVDDPVEVKAMSKSGRSTLTSDVEPMSEGDAAVNRWRRRLSGRLRPSGSGSSAALSRPGDLHQVQPWFHSGMSREQAAQLVARHGAGDGVFLVRESRSTPGSYVLTVKCSGKVIHSQITPVMDPVRNTIYYTLDNGVTKFYDLLQLVEFYQLNAGCLPTRLSQFVVHSSTPTIRQFPSSF